MNRLFLIIVLLFITVGSKAIDYRIVALNSGSIKIGKKKCQKGDIFTDKDQIYWTSKDQAIKAINTNTLETKLFRAEEFMNEGTKTVRDYFLKTNHLSTRGTDSIQSSSTEQTLYMLDNISIAPQLVIDDLHYYELKCLSGQDTLVKKLNYEDDQLIISLNELPEEIKSGGSIISSLLYKNAELDSSLVIIEKLKIIVLPQNINHK